MRQTFELGHSTIDFFDSSSLTEFDIPIPRFRLSSILAQGSLFYELLCVARQLVQSAKIVYDPSRTQLCLHAARVGDCQND